jgi:CheY-like chemotaxis protein
MGQGINILVADDSEDDVLFLRRAFVRAHSNAVLTHVVDGEMTIDYLAGRGIYADRERCPFPQLMILDTKMPRTNGFEVLEWTRGEGGLRSLPIIMWSSGGEQREVDRAFELGVNSYLVKPHGLEQLDLVGRALKDFWLETCGLPSVGPVVAS